MARLPTTHQNTLSHLMKHLQKLATYHEVTGMTSRNLAIVWAPNLLRPNSEDCLRDCGLQALVVEALIVYWDEIFTPEGADFVCVTRRNFTKEVSIDQAVERAESIKPRPAERRMVRSISCVSNIRLPSTERSRPGLFQGRGVMLRRDRSLTCDTTTRRQVTTHTLHTLHSSHTLHFNTPHTPHTAHHRIYFLATSAGCSEDEARKMS